MFSTTGERAEGQHKNRGSHRYKDLWDEQICQCNTECVWLLSTPLLLTLHASFIQCTWLAFQIPTFNAIHGLPPRQELNAVRLHYADYWDTWKQVTPHAPISSLQAIKWKRGLSRQRFRHQHKHTSRHCWAGTSLANCTALHKCRLSQRRKKKLEHKKVKGKILLVTQGTIFIIILCC